MILTELSTNAPLLAPRTTRRVLSVLRWPYGGIRTYILYHYPTLLEAGYRFTVVGPANADFRALCREMRDWPGIAFAEAPTRGHSCDLRGTVRRLVRTQQFDLVHSNGMVAAAAVSLATLGLNVRHVISSHDVFRKDQTRGVVGRLKLMMLGWLLNRADTIVSVSQDAQANLLEHIPRLTAGRPRLVSVLNGIDVDRFACPETSDDLRRQLDLGPDVFLMGFLGRFMEQKGFLPLLRAMKRLRDGGTPRPFHLAAVGSGDYVREYRAEAERLGLLDRISFLPFVPDIAPILGQLDVMVMPSLWEACGLLAMEAMAAGVPVVGTDCVGLREVLRDTPSLTTRTNDPESLADGLRRAMDSSWAGKARAFAPVARERFSAVRAAGQLRKVFDDVLAHSH